MKKIVSLLLSFIMVAALFPLNAWAVGIKLEDISENAVVNEEIQTEQNYSEEVLNGEEILTDNEFEGPEFVVTDEELKYGPDEAVLIDLLTDRNFVVQTLTQDFITKNNPNLGYTQDYLYKGILERYMEDPAFAAAVVLWDDAHNLGSVAMEVPSALADIFASEEEWANFIKGTESKKYEQVISKLLTSEYTSDSGLSTAQEYANNQYMRELYESTKNIGDFLNNAEKVNDVLANANSLFQVQYIDDILRKYKSGAKEYFRFIQDMTDFAVFNTLKPGSEEAKKVDNFYKVLYVAWYGTDNKEDNMWKTSFDIEFTTPAVGDALETAGILVDTSTTVLNYFLILETTIGQKDMLIDVFERSLKYGSDAYDRMAKKYINILKDYDEPGNIIGNTILDTASSIISKELGSLMTKTFEGSATKMAANNKLLRKYLNEDASTRYVANVAQKASTYLSAIEFAADVCVDFSDLAEKTYELVFINDMKSYFVAQYYDDVANYNAAVERGASVEERNELAKMAIDDLTILKLILLRANEIAYKMTSELSEQSLVGLVEGWMTGQNASESIEHNYNVIKNALVDTMINPYSTGTFTVESDTVLDIYPADDGKNLRAVYHKDGESINIGEFQFRILEGLDVNGTVNVYTDMYTHFINSGGGRINVNGNNLVFCQGMDGNFTLGGTGTLEVGEKYTSKSFKVLEGAKFAATEIETTGNLHSLDRVADIYGEVEVKGNLTVEYYSEFNIYDTGYVLVHGNYSGEGYTKVKKGTLEVKGDVYNSGDGFPAAQLILSGDKPQDISGYFIGIKAANEQITANNGFSAEKLLSDFNFVGDVPSASINDFSGYTLTVNGNAYYHDGMNGNLVVTGKLTMKNSTISEGAKITAGEMETIGDNHSLYRIIAIYGKIEVLGNLTVPSYSEFNIYESGHVLVHGNYSGQGYTKANKGTLEVEGDVYNLGDGFPAAQLILSGDKPQNIDGRFIGIRAENEHITANNGFSTEKLLSDINFVGDVPSISINDFSGYTLTVNGNAYYHDGMNGNLVVTGKLTMKNSTISEGAKITAGEMETIGDNHSLYRIIAIYGKIEVLGNLTVPSYSEFNIYETGHVLVHGNYSGQGYTKANKGTLEVKGDVYNSGDGFPAAQLILSGDKPQNIDGQFIGIRAENEHITANNGFSAEKLLSDINFVGDVPSISINDFNGYSVKINGNLRCDSYISGNLVVTGKLTMKNSTIGEDAKVTAGEMETIGDSNSHYRVVAVYGEVEVFGNLTVPSYSAFNIYETGHVLVHGNYSGQGYTKANKGTLDVKGDVYNSGDGFPAAQLILSGDKPQYINGSFVGVKATNRQITIGPWVYIKDLLSDIYLLKDPGASIGVENYNGYSVIVLKYDIYGDVDGNGKINVLDANLVRRAAAKMITLAEGPQKAADVDGNSKINVMDANLIRRYAAKIITEFPIEK